MILGIGIDIIEVKRVENSLLRFGERFMRRIFTKKEIAYCSAKKNAAMHFAGRFAAKEAAFKAIQTGWGGKVGWTDVEITNLSSGAPVITFSGKALEVAQSRGMTDAHVSISHVGDLAIAIVILER